MSTDPLILDFDDYCDLSSDQRRSFSAWLTECLRSAYPDPLPLVRAVRLGEGSLELEVLADRHGRPAHTAHEVDLEYPDGLNVAGRTCRVTCPAPQLPPVWKPLPGVGVATSCS